MRQYNIDFVPRCGC